MVCFLAVMAVAGYYVFNEAVAVDAANRIGVPIGKDLVVPDVQGFHKDTARIKLEEAGLSYSESTAMPSAKIQRDYVMLQRPEPGSVVRAGRRVYVTLSFGQDNETVPDVRGMTEAEARSTIEKTILTVSPTVSRYTTASKPPGTVLSQYPMPGQVVPRSVQVALLISEGQNADTPRVQLVPSLVGLKIEEAEAKLKGLGFSMAKAKDSNPDAETGVVLRQFPEEGKEIVIGGTVTVNVRMEEDTEDLGRRVEVSYTLPQGFGEREVTFKVIDVFGNITTKSQRVKPGYRVTVPCTYTNTMTVEILLDGALSRRIVYEEDKPPRVTEF